MSSGNGERVEGTRAARRQRTRRRRTAEVAVAAALAAGGIWYAATQASDVGEGPGSAGATGAGGGSQLVALTVTGAPAPIVAVVGAGTDPAFVVLPPDLQLVVPGQGDATVGDVAALPADSSRVAVSNLMGGWIAHYAELDLGAFGGLVDRAGGITVRLPDAVAVGADVLGPGETTMDGATAIDFLFTSPPGRVAGRFAQVLSALLEAPPAVREGDLSASDDVAAVGRTLQRALGATVAFAPTRRVEGRLTVPAHPEFDEWVQERFGVPPPLRVIVENGSGAPGVGEAIAAKLLPGGFRVVLSRNAPSFDHARTDVIAEGPEFVDAARKARRLLGLGTVVMSQVPSGVGDVTIVVGKDFEA